MYGLNTFHRSILKILLSIFLLINFTTLARAQTLEDCPVPACPTYTGVVKECSCGDTLFRRNQSNAPKYCCRLQNFSLQDRPCDDTARQQHELEATFCSVSALAAKEGLIVGFELTTSVRIGVHRSIVPRLETVRAKLRDVKYPIDAQSTVGFNPRPVRSDGGGEATFSTHAYGIAIDLNWNRNPYCPLFPSVGKCTKCESALESDLPRELISAFESEGFEWGGNWSVPDPMHFELQRDFWPVEGCEHWRSAAHKERQSQ